MIVLLVGLWALGLSWIPSPNSPPAPLSHATLVSREPAPNLSFHLEGSPLAGSRETLEGDPKLWLEQQEELWRSQGLDIQRSGGENHYILQGRDDSGEKKGVMLLKQREGNWSLVHLNPKSQGAQPKGDLPTPPSSQLLLQHLDGQNRQLAMYRCDLDPLSTERTLKAELEGQGWILDLSQEDLRLFSRGAQRCWIHIRGEHNPCLVTLLHET